jgi:predicted amidohydrolase YtcJ
MMEPRCPWRLHATYDEAISQRSIDRVAALGGGIAVQHRMAYRARTSSTDTAPGRPRRRRRSSASSRPA